MSLSSVQILDGGLGTTLEDILGINISNTPLWSANLIKNDPEVLIKAHTLFLEAGATLLETATYQCSFDTCIAAGYLHEEAVDIMRHGVQLAAIARSQFLKSRTLRDAPMLKIKIVLSLGPYGASLSPAQEFSGVYPPPFGPPHASATGGQPDLNFTPEERARGLEDAAVDALAKWHLARLEVFAQHRETWDSIDCIAFETVPLNTEVRAIRQAMQTLFAQDVAAKDWWISGVFPAGRAPGALESETGVIAFVKAALGVESDAERPTGVGINCTPPQFVSGLAQELEGSIQKLYPEGTKPWLVLYPNGGGVYDGFTRTWNESIPAPPAKWAQELGDTARRVQVTGTFSNVVLGGCCKTKPEDIAVLKECTELGQNQ